MTWERIKEATKDTRARINHGAVAAVEKVQGSTGLKLRETLGWAREAKQRVKATTVEVENVIERVVEDTKAAVEQKVDGIKEEIAVKVEQVEEQIVQAEKKGEQEVQVAQEGDKKDEGSGRII